MDKRTKLLRSLMMPALRKNELYKTGLSVDYVTKTFKLSKKVIGNIYVTIDLDFENYQQRVVKMADAFKTTVTSDILEFPMKKIKFVRSDNPIKFTGVAEGGAVPNYDQIQFNYHYGAPPDVEYISNNTLHNHLCKLGYKFEENDHRIKLEINSHLYISYYKLAKIISYNLDTHGYDISREVNPKTFCKFISMFTMAWNLETENDPAKGADL